MIEINEVFSDADSRMAWLCDKAMDTNELAMMAEDISKEKVRLISVMPDIVPCMWTWLEKIGVKILARYVFNPLQKSMIDEETYDLGAKITDVLKKGATGVQIFVKMRDFEYFVETIEFVRDDLFFDHDLCIALDISDIAIDDWPKVFQKLCDVRAHALVLSLNEDMGNRSDFVGRVYGMLQNWNFNGEVHFILGNNFDRIDQVIRLIEIEKSELANRVKFFLDY